MRRRTEMNREGDNNVEPMTMEMREPAGGWPLKRDEILAALRAALEPLDYVHAMWEGGAASFGRVDQWSDIDLQVDTDDEHAPEIFAIVERALEELTTIEVKVEIPQPAWHGHHQAFYRLRDAGPFLQLDIVAVVHSNPNKFLETAIHGTPVVHFDKSGVTAPVKIDVEETLAKLRLTVAVPEDQTSAVRLADVVDFTVPAWPQRSFTGVVVRLAHSVDTKTRTMPVELDVDNRADDLSDLARRLAAGIWSHDFPEEGMVVRPAAVVADGRLDRFRDNREIVREHFMQRLADKLWRLFERLVVVGDVRCIVPAVVDLHRRLVDRRLQRVRRVGQRFYFQCHERTPSLGSLIS